jgi:hypothetical protein
LMMGLDAVHRHCRTAFAETPDRQRNRVELNAARSAE